MENEALREVVSSQTGLKDLVVNYIGERLAAEEEMTKGTQILLEGQYSNISAVRMRGRSSRAARKGKGKGRRRGGKVNAVNLSPERQRKNQVCFDKVKYYSKKSKLKPK